MTSPGTDGAEAVVDGSSSSWKLSGEGERDRDEAEEGGGRTIVELRRRYPKVGCFFLEGEEESDAL